MAQAAVSSALLVAIVALAFSTKPYAFSPGYCFRRRVEEKTIWELKSLGGLKNVTIKSVSEFSSSPSEDHRPRTSPVLSLDLGRSILADFVRVADLSSSSREASLFGFLV